MNRGIFGTLMIAGLLIGGCTHNPILTAQTAREDVFAEITSSEAGLGKAIAEIKFTVKSNSSRFLEIYNKHSNPPYRVLLNIDGQATVLEAEPILEDKAPIDPTTPESGIGWKYQFSKRIAIVPGKHILTIALPVDGVLVAREIELRAGINTISMMPVYGKRLLRPYDGQNFSAGVKSVEVVVN